MPRAEVYARVDARVDAMIAAGWVDEARSLIARGYDERMSSIFSHGYREMMAVARGTMSVEEAAQKTKWMVHAYVRRQDLWLRKQPEYRWLQAGPDALEQASVIVQRFLSSG
jgi:tRNA dimethylallyltransferase